MKIPPATRLPALATCVALVAINSAYAAQDASELLAPAAIGATRAEVEAKVPLHCQAQICQPAAGALRELASVPLDRAELRFDDDRLARVSVRFAIQHYEAMLGTLRARFGKGADHSFQARAGMAGEFSAGVFVWVQSDLALVLEQYAGKIDKSRLTYGTPAAMTDLVRAKTAAPRGARRDL